MQKAKFYSFNLLIYLFLNIHLPVQWLQETEGAPGMLRSTKKETKQRLELILMLQDCLLRNGDIYIRTCGWQGTNWMTNGQIECLLSCWCDFSLIYQVNYLVFPVKEVHKFSENRLWLESKRVPCSTQRRMPKQSGWLLGWNMAHDTENLCVCMFFYSLHLCQTHTHTHISLIPSFEK